MTGPMPRVNATSRPFWDGLAEGRVLVQRCTADGCGRHVFYPRVACPHCHRDTLEWTEVSGRGTVVSHTTVHRPHHESFMPLVPYVFVAVRLEEGPLLYGRLEDADPAASGLLGRAVEPVFQRMGEGATILGFRLAGG